MKKLVIVVFIISLLVCQTAVSLSACEFPAEEQGLQLGAKAGIDDSVPVPMGTHAGVQKTMDVLDVVTAPLIPFALLGGGIGSFFGVRHIQRLSGKGAAYGPTGGTGFAAGDIIFFVDLMDVDHSSNTQSNKGDIQ